MILRMWHGMTKAADAAEYLRFLEARAIPDYRSVPGNLGVQVLHRLEGDRAHFLTVSWWESREAIAGFAGSDIEIAKYYPEDRRFLLEFERTVTHWEVTGAFGASRT
jgi:heme-degrading monooxygenase HmoA